MRESSSGPWRQQRVVPTFASQLGATHRPYQPVLRVGRQPKQQSRQSLLRLRIQGFDLRPSPERVFLVGYGDALGSLGAHRPSTGPLRGCEQIWPENTTVER